MKRIAIGLVALGSLVLAGAASALPMAPPAAREDVIQIKGGHGHGGGHFHMNRGRHLGWTRGRHRGWSHSHRR
jgi:hypothetical protein